MWKIFAISLHQNNKTFYLDKAFPFDKYHGREVHLTSEAYHIG